MTRQRLAVLGSPIAHSLSPRLHAAAYAALGLDWEYGSHDVDAGGLEGFLGSLDESWRGLSLTMPLKERALELADDVDRLARLTGAVNTLAIRGDGRDRRLHGFNTDVAGLVASIGDAGLDSATHVRILGGGATARSALVAASELGAASVVVSLRTPAKAAPLIALGRELGLVVTAESLDAGLTGVQPASLISTLPGGVGLQLGFDAAETDGALLVDVAYAPWPTAVASEWTGAGGRAVSGLGMLLHQAVRQVRIFTGGDPLVPLPAEHDVIEAMRESLGSSAVE